MNKEVTKEMHNLLNLICRFLQTRDEGDEHYKVLFNLVYFQCRDYMKLVEETVRKINSGEEE
jgi:hypothetical protein